MKQQVELHGELGGHISIELINRPHANSPWGGSIDYWDAGWIQAVLTAKVRSFSATTNAYLHIHDLQPAVAEITKLLDGVTDKASLHSLESCLTLTFTRNSLGTITVEGELAEALAAGATLSFQFESDHESVSKFAKGLVKALGGLFPGN